MNTQYGSIHIKTVGKFIVPGNNTDERKQYCHNLLNSIDGVFIPKLGEKYTKIIAIGTIPDYFVLTVDDICSDDFNYCLICNYIKDMLKLEAYFDDPRYKKRLEMLSELSFDKITTDDMFDDEHATSLSGTSSKYNPINVGDLDKFIIPDNSKYGSIHIKNVGKFIVPGNNINERKQYCHNLLNSVKGVFVPKLGKEYSKIIAIGTISDYFVLTVDSICSNEFDYYMIDGYIEDMLKLNDYFSDSYYDTRYRKRLEILYEMLCIKILITNMSNDEYQLLLLSLNEFISATLDLNELEETKYEDDFDQKIYDKQLLIDTLNFDIKYNNLIRIAPYLRLYSSNSKLYGQYCLLSEFFVIHNNKWNKILITSTYWLHLSMRLHSIREEIESIRHNKFL